MEMRRDKELIQTIVAQLAAYSYSHERIHSTPRSSPSYSRHIDSLAVLSTEQHRNQLRRPDPPHAGNDVQAFVDQGRGRHEAELAAQLAVPQQSPVYQSTSVGAGVTSRTLGVPCLVPTLRNERLSKDFKGPRKVPNYTAYQPPEAWIESYEMAMEMLDVSDAACVKYFTMMLDGLARNLLKGLPANSIGSLVELKS